MSGDELDVDQFVRVLLEAVVRAGNVSCRVVNPTELEFVIGDDVSRVTADAVAGRFRMVCARLAVTFDGNRCDPPVLYGGRLQKRLVVSDGVLEADLDFKNTQDGWFTLRRVTGRP